MFTFFKTFLQKVLHFVFYYAIIKLQTKEDKNMKKLFRLKLELIQLIAMFIGSALIYSINDSYKSDYKIDILYFMLIGGCIFSIIAYKPIKEFRKEVLRRW